MSFKGIGFKYFALVLALIAIVAGVYLTFFQSSGYEKTTATIVSVTELPKDFEDEDTQHEVTVEYTVNGQKYTEILDYYSPSFAVGKTVNVKYNPDNPSEVHGGSGFGIYILIIGIVIAAVVIFSIVRGKMSLKKIKEADAAAMVIMCSAMGQQAMVIEAIQGGAKDFIVKPFQAERVLEAVKKVVG